MKDWIDITRPIDDGMTCWPGRNPPKRKWERRMANGDHCNASLWELSAHCGTHLDAPLHFVENGDPIDTIPADVLIGECAVIATDPDGNEPLEGEMVEDCFGQSKILVKSQHSEPSSEKAYRDHTPLMTQAAASRLLEGGLLLLGTDRLSVDDSRGKGFALHRLLLEAGCLILEGVYLANVPPGRYQLIVLPLRLTGAEASPARALLAPWGTRASSKDA